jgi:hypothetical protein
MDKSWNSAYQAYLGLANTLGIDRVLFTADAPYGSMKASRQCFDQMPINVNDKEKIAHLNAEPPARALLRSQEKTCTASLNLSGRPIAVVPMNEGSGTGASDC